VPKDGTPVIFWLSRQDASQLDSLFLHSTLFNVLLRSHTGPFLFEFQRHGVSSEEFSSRWDTFFGQLPKEFLYSVEIRNAGLLGPYYRKVLENNGVAHVYNHWSYMPSLAEQHQRMEERFTALFTVLRFLTPLKMSYEAAKKRAEPYTKLVDELLDMHRTRRDSNTYASISTKITGHWHRKTRAVA